jgi:Fe2+ transport system protein FeoA
MGARVRVEGIDRKSGMSFRLVELGIGCICKDSNVAIADKSARSS